MHSNYPSFNAVRLFLNTNTYSTKADHLKYCLTSIFQNTYQAPVGNYFAGILALLPKAKCLKKYTEKAENFIQRFFFKITPRTSEFLVLRLFVVQTIHLDILQAQSVYLLFNKIQSISGWYGMLAARVSRAKARVEAK